MGYDDRAFEARSQRCQARTRPRRNEQREGQTRKSQTQSNLSENNQARQIDTTNRSTIKRRGMLQWQEKELNNAMSEHESRKTTW